MDSVTVCKKMRWEGSSFNLVSEQLLDFFLPPPSLQLNMVVVMHCNNPFAFKKQKSLFLSLPQAFCILPLQFCKVVSHMIKQQWIRQLAQHCSTEKQVLRQRPHIICCVLSQRLLSNQGLEKIQDRKRKLHHQLLDFLLQNLWLKNRTTDPHPLKTPTTYWTRSFGRVGVFFWQC